MTCQEMTAENVLNSRWALSRFLAGFDDSNHTTQAPGLPNHVAWTLGHLAFYLNRVAEKFDGKPMPASDFIAGEKGDSTRFGVESVAFGSNPAAGASSFPGFARCNEIWSAAIDRLATAVRGASDTKFDETTKWGALERPLWAVVSMMIFHNGTHNGQIVDLRRALGMSRILG